VERIREYILAGDAFQVQLGRRIAVPHDFPSDALYRALRALNPSPYMYHLVLDGVELVGSSPELLLRVSGGRATVRPIAGTRPRGATPEQDAELVEELTGDEKELAEHVMLVDLGRNDIGRVARYGSVEVSDYKVVERYSHVFHLVSQVDGDLREGLDALDAFRAAFPAGRSPARRRSGRWRSSTSSSRSVAAPTAARSDTSAPAERAWTSRSRSGRA
jgi:anthranilate synthase component 1